MDQYMKFVQYVVLAVLGGTGASVLVTGDFTDRTVLIGLGITLGFRRIRPELQCRALLFDFGPLRDPIPGPVDAGHAIPERPD